MSAKKELHSYIDGLTEEEARREIIRARALLLEWRAEHRPLAL